jgi:hypothetical protein
MAGRDVVAALRLAPLLRASARAEAVLLVERLAALMAAPQPIQKV